mmetsp:Transcript_7669/g.17419  ORF Transcript_7669/g.17419 Transcript_7669/m.17419 type:complete len:94 (+) Transcript_7669:2-283(+)
MESTLVNVCTRRNGPNGRAPVRQLPGRLSALREGPQRQLLQHPQPGVLHIARVPEEISIVLHTTQVHTLHFVQPGGYFTSAVEFARAASAPCA